MPRPGAAGYQLSNPSMLDLTAVIASLEVFHMSSMAKLRRKSLSLTAYLRSLLLHPLQGASPEDRLFVILALNQMSDNFTDHHIISLAENLPNLETFYPSGFGITDSVFHSVARLRSLKDMQFLGITQFTPTGIADFISSLDADTNKGLVLTLWAVDADSALSEESEAFLRELISTRLDGKFSMTLWREAESEFDSESD